MIFALAIIIYLVIFFLVFFITQGFEINYWSSIIFSLFVSDLVLITLYTPPFYQQVPPQDYQVVVYQIIQVITFILVLTYILERIFSDRRSSMTSFGFPTHNIKKESFF